MIRLSLEARNEQANALAALLDGGYLRIYGGHRPETPDTPAPNQPLLAELRFGSPAAFPAERGQVEFHEIDDEDDAPESGTATWFRCYRSDGREAVLDGTVGAARADLILDNPEIVAGGRVSVESFVHAID